MSASVATGVILALVGALIGLALALDFFAAWVRTKNRRPKPLELPTAKHDIDWRAFGRVHSPEECTGRACVVHAPSAHHMRGWSQTWRPDRRLVERKCSHGVGHPDPDDMEFHLANGDQWIGIHGCDGCCAPPARADKVVHLRGPDPTTTRPEGGKS